jgi:LysR family transcriptional regulator, regulator for metE and metH
MTRDLRSIPPTAESLARVATSSNYNKHTSFSPRRSRSNLPGVHANVCGMKDAHNTVHAALLDVELRHLRLMVAIADSGSITRAGQHLHLTQSALSHQLRDLEDRLRVQLFTRSRSGLAPTAAGHAMVTVARDVLSRLQTAREELATIAGHDEAPLRITTECHTCYHWLPQVLRRLHARYPGVQAEVVVNATSRPLQALADGDVDVAIVYTLPTRGSLATRFLFDDELIAAVPPQHPLARRAFLQPWDFADYTALLYNTVRRESLVFRKFFVTGKHEPKNVVQVQLTEAMIEMIKADLGIGVLTRWSAEHEIKAGRLVALPLGRGGLHRPWHAAFRKQKAMPAHFAEFIDLLRSAFPGGVAKVALTAS